MGLFEYLGYMSLLLWLKSREKYQHKWIEQPAYYQYDLSSVVFWCGQITKDVTKPANANDVTLWIIGIAFARPT